MRIFLTAIVILIISYFIRTDLQEGTIPKAAFYSEGTGISDCADTLEPDVIPVTVVKDDTVRSLFALYPDDMDLLTRLSEFYKLNPHLKNQQPAAGETVFLPLSSGSGDTCR
ncbi:hypothetical protein [Bhargavaea beijingensis]|uniref:Uncharacterized protein n=1 Tax=Bhargavaea beijingensis TaxID=426756 RepID=A0A1G7CT76_9BACL|nr:hypothetical protein [Bhargavaea beijingensis]MCW1927110.1 hypothetical protein [Bhargavaea beijingensis]RSK30836.1 hypothetical protein EJA12_08920 [Bhargavaea beijingensis]SDE42518.1 hypothetical protein SAMN04488126_108112 [Bhargavaea beijingensis]